jgi:hypothetical protein
LYEEETKLKNIRVKGYDLTWKRCTRGMQVKIEARKDFENLMKNNPIDFLPAIKQHSLNFQERRFKILISLDSLKTLITRDRDIRRLDEMHEEI